MNKKLLIPTKGILFFTIGIMLIAGCKNKQLKVDVSRLEPGMEIYRYEQELFGTDPSMVKQKAIELAEKYPLFTNYLVYLINIPETSDPRYPEFMEAFVTSKMINDSYLESRKITGDGKWLEEELREAFRHYKHYFPEKGSPDIYTFISGFNNSLVIDSLLIGIGMDRYLGPEYPYYAKLGLPLHLRKNMYPKKIPSDLMFSWGGTEFPFKGDADNVINNIIYEGKLHYYVKAMMPDEHDYRIMGFTEDELKWCRDNELEMWTYLVENKLLFDTKRLTIVKLVGDAPFTNFFPKESPGRAAVWLGLKIVENYMKNSPDTGLRELMENNDYKEILRVSKFRPH